MGIFRLLLAVCVLFQHGIPFGHFNYLAGSFAVEAFFVISGFYMALVLTERYNYERLGKNWVLKFYAARYLRLYPAYLISAAALALLYWSAATFFHSKPEPWLEWKALLSLPHTFRNVLLLIWAGVSNLTIFLQDLGGVLAVRDQQAIFTVHRTASEIYVWILIVNGVAWSLGVELLFYLVAPYFIRRSNLQLLLVVLVALALKVYSILTLSDDLPYRTDDITYRADDLPYRMFPFVLVDFLLGMLTYRMRARLIEFAGRYTLAIAYCLMLVLTVALPRSLQNWQFSLLAVALTALIVPALFYRSKNSKLDNKLGELSYPIYLFHMMVISLLHFALTKRAGISNSYAISICDVAATMGLSYLVLALENRFIEPYRQRLGRPSATPEQVASASLKPAR